MLEICNVYMKNLKSIRKLSFENKPTKKNCINLQKLSKFLLINDTETQLPCQKFVEIDIEIEEHTLTSNGCCSGSIFDGTTRREFRGL